MRLPSKVLTIAAAAALVAPAAAVAAPSSHGNQSADHGAAIVKPISAQAFLPAAAQSNQFEITTGQLAQQRAQSSEIRSLGAMFVADHTRLLQQGAAVARQLGVTVPSGLNPQQQATVDRLQQLSGPAFDAAWLKAQLAAHVQALALNLRGAIAGQPEQIRTLAQGALPIVTHHFGELIDLASSARDGHDGHDGHDGGTKGGDDHGHRHGHDGNRHRHGDRHHAVRA